jgi:hypothetical protein
MFKKIFCSLFFLIAFNICKGKIDIKTDSLLKIIQIKDRDTRENTLVRYLEMHIRRFGAADNEEIKKAYKNFLYSNKVENRWALDYFIESICLQRLSRRNAADVALLKAINLAYKNEDHMLLYNFLTDLAYNQTEEGNALQAILSYRLAKKEVAKMDNAYLQLILDVNISDVYYKNNYYSQSLYFLNEAEAINNNPKQKDERIIKNSERTEVVIDYNKCENFFRMNKPDSLKLYHEKLMRSTFRPHRLYTYQNRTAYYLYLADSDYKRAIKHIIAMRKDKRYVFANLDKQNLADAYYKNGQADSAVNLVQKLLADSVEINHPEIKLHQYELLAEIAEKKNDHHTASSNYKLALKEAEDYNNRLTQVGNVTSLIKIDDIETAYNRRGEAFQRERVWLIFTICVALFLVAIIAVIYWNIKQKRHYEHLLFTQKKKELAFINSHEVRKHLTNILGLIEVIKHSENPEKEFFNSEERLFYSAEELDTAIKNISDKLGEE